jgi:(R)-2-hydroxyacyl-CoA dehydratese activating ATPase
VAMVKLLEDAVGMKINVSPDAHFCGALGAALFARDHVFAQAAKPAAAHA